VRGIAAPGILASQAKSPDDPQFGFIGLSSTVVADFDFRSMSEIVKEPAAQSFA
jgi:hypothetical protein